MKRQGIEEVDRVSDMEAAEAEEAQEEEILEEEEHCLQESEYKA